MSCRKKQKYENYSKSISEGLTTEINMREKNAETMNFFRAVTCSEMKTPWSLPQQDFKHGKA